MLPKFDVGSILLCEMETDAAFRYCVVVSESDSFILLAVLVCVAMNVIVFETFTFVLCAM